MERVWIVSEEIYAKRDSLPASRHAEVVPVRDLNQLERQLEDGERPVLLGSLAVLRQARERFPRLLAMDLLPPDGPPERLSFAVRSVLQEARLQHDLEAAENIPWSGGAGGQFDDPSIELLGAHILELSAARDMEAVEQTLLKACAEVAPVSSVRAIAHPETASSRNIGLYQLAVPIQFQDSLKAHVYVRFAEEPDRGMIDRVGEALLNLSDAVALAVERNQMILKAEETKTVWEASFDAVADPVAILDENYLVIRGNRAYGIVTNTPLVKLAGKEPRLVDPEGLRALPTEETSEWTIEHERKHYRVFFDPIRAPLGAGRFVLRFHDISEERSLTEKILAKEQVAELGILVGSVAHEINNPIGGILAIGQILQKDLAPGTPLRQDVDNIVEAAERCRKIVRTMLSLVRKADEEKRDCSIGECMQSAMDLLSSEARRHQVKTVVSLPSPLPPVQANRNRLLQVFFHLLQQSLLAIAERKGKQAFEAVLRIELIPGYGHLEARILDNGDPVKHEYEIQSSVAFTVSKMILDEHEVGYIFRRQDGMNEQRLIFSLPGDNASSGS
jgi:nitrogen-specific signal transduction histidine kinase